MKDNTMKKPSLMDDGFKYTRSGETDIRATFRRIRRAMKEAEAAKKPASNVKVLTKKGAKP